jgi:hypothetical protein
MVNNPGPCGEQFLQARGDPGPRPAAGAGEFDHSGAPVAGEFGHGRGVTLPRHPRVRAHQGVRLTCCWERLGGTATERPGTHGRPVPGAVGGTFAIGFAAEGEQGECGEKPGTAHRH